MRIAIATPAEAGRPEADVLLLPGRAAFLPATATLLVADLHLGKAATFRKAGIPVPEGSAQADLARLERLVRETSARRLVLPAFGSFTGGHRVTPAPGLRLWIARDDGVVEVTRLAGLATRPL